MPSSAKAPTSAPAGKAALGLFSINPNKQMGRTDKQMGRTDKPMGHTDKLMGCTDKQMGHTDKPMGRTDKPVGHTDKLKGHQPVKVFFKVQKSQDISRQVRTGHVQSGQVSKSHIHFRTRKEKTGQGIWRQEK